MKTAFVIQITQLGQYWTKSANTDFISRIGRRWSGQCSWIELRFRL